ncbi:hypothetical protein G6F37_003038 [Rhizopus arrhizus]|nr:hypothetical protein G6F38_001178 [Rhizopus arrhizus]KAG1161467.1 hypothetical protein G6F37_003038 [Rhizopus arrhizus]
MPNTTANRRLNQIKTILSSVDKMSTNSLEVEIIQKDRLGQIILNRPNKLNALNLSMVQMMTPQIKAWEKSEMIDVILLKHSGGKGFCAGGDVKMVVDLAKAKDPNATEFFRKEYQLDHLIATLHTPFIAIMNGITMGGGVGLSVHAPFRVATENTLFAMPETAIGFLPEVGGSFFLSRLDGQLGVYLGLTGKRLKGVDVLYAGIATHYIPSSRLADLEQCLSRLKSPTYDTINQVLDQFSPDLSHTTFSLAGSSARSIDRCFRHHTIAEIIEAIEKEEACEWTKETLTLLSSMSPTSLKVTLEQIRRGKSMSLAQCFQMEYQLVQKFLGGHDFREGVYSTLVTRSRPNWQPSQLAEVSESKIIQDYFESPSPLDLVFLNQRDFKSYPHHQYMLPSEKDILSIRLSRQQVVNHFVNEYRGKQGVKQKVLDVLNRYMVY